jgi:predicted small metal-binding protein
LSNRYFRKVNGYGDDSIIKSSLFPRSRGIVVISTKKGGGKMAYSLACRDAGDAGIDCSYVGLADTIEELFEDAMNHVKDAHGYTDEQLNDPKFLEETKKLVKQI